MEHFVYDCSFTTIECLISVQGTLNYLESELLIVYLVYISWKEGTSGKRFLLLFNFFDIITFFPSLSSLQILPYIPPQSPSNSWLSSFTSCYCVHTYICMSIHMYVLHIYVDIPKDNLFRADHLVPDTDRRALPWGRPPPVPTFLQLPVVLWWAGGLWIFSV